MAHVQREEGWEVLSLPAIAENSTTYEFATPYGRRVVRREVGEVLHAAVLPRYELDRMRRGMTEYHFAAQFQQDPQPPSGLIVLRKWLKFYDERTKPFRQDRAILGYGQ